MFGFYGGQNMVRTPTEGYSPFRRRCASAAAAAAVQCATVQNKLMVKNCPPFGTTYYYYYYYCNLILCEAIILHISAAYKIVKIIVRTYRDIRTKLISAKLIKTHCSGSGN